MRFSCSSGKRKTERFYSRKRGINTAERKLADCCIYESTACASCALSSLLPDECNREYKAMKKVAHSYTF